MIATCTILGFTDFENWGELMRCFSNPTEILTRCRTFKSSSLSNFQIDTVESVLQKPGFTIESIKKKSLPASHFAEWVIAVYNQATLETEVTRTPVQATLPQGPSPQKARVSTAPVVTHVERTYQGPVSVEVLHSAAPPERVQPQRVTQFASRKVTGEASSGYKHRNLEMEAQTAEIQAEFARLLAEKGM